MKKIIYILCVLYFLISCSESNKKDIPYYEIYKIDNMTTDSDNPIQIIDSLLKIYPRSEYLHGMKIMELANLGLTDSAINYHNYIATKYHGINGSFMEMGFEQAAMIYQFSNGWLNDDYNFIKSLELDEYEVNIWARIGVALVNLDFAYKIDESKADILTDDAKQEKYKKGIQYLLSAYEINPTNNYLLMLLTDFYMDADSYHTAKIYLDEIDSDFHLEKIDELRVKLDSLLNLK
jgi:tetratricopeptide (TPR) repeat protein